MLRVPCPTPGSFILILRSAYPSISQRVALCSSIFVVAPGCASFLGGDSVEGVFPRGLKTDNVPQKGKRGSSHVFRVRAWRADVLQQRCHRQAPEAISKLLKSFENLTVSMGRNGSKMGHFVLRMSQNRRGAIKKILIKSVAYAGSSWHIACTDAKCRYSKNLRGRSCL